MSISHLDHLKASTSGLGGHAESGLVSEPPQADVDLFNASMHAQSLQASSSGGALSEQVAQALSERIGAMDKLSQQAMRKMKAAVSSTAPMDIAQMSRSLSQYSLQMALTTKVVSKSGQALDKLTNLQ